MMPVEPLVSVVTPVYNEAEHLAQCIETILAQTYANWEYTIVDNHSTDGSFEIAREYAAKDHRIRISKNPDFLPAIRNHNGALRQVSPNAKYCKMVFADDWIFPECLEQMVAVAEAHPSVGIVGAYGLRGNEVAWTGLPYPSTIVPGLEVCRQFFVNRVYVFGSATSLLYRADLVRARDPFFNEANVHADTEVCFEFLRNCDFGFVHQVLTFTRMRPESRFASSTHWNTMLASSLSDLMIYGPGCLTRDTFAACVLSRLAEYYDFLSAYAIRSTPKEFWDYHKKALADAGFGYDRWRLAKATVARLVRAAADPQNVMRKVRKRDEEFAGRRDALHSA
jgi:glycosyltransferase involved in cell wall biosynthesis